jgi:glycosyltransferase involved in cell wall biosynthesis
MPSVSVIVPVFNAEAYLSECLQGLVDQSFRDFEIICVNDGSTDGSRGILGQFAASDDRVRIIDQDNEGPSAARNGGLAIATGEYVMFLDADDFFEPTMIEEVYGRSKEHDADICVFRVRRLSPDTAALVDADWSLRMELVPERLPFAPDEMDGHLFRFCTPAVWNKMFRRSFVEAAGLEFPPELRRAEDVPFTWMALALATRITVLDRALVNYRAQHDSGLLATIHAAPLDIVRALLQVKRDAAAADAFAQIERDFVNAALEQCLFNLDALGTAESAHALFERLRESGFVELGIAERGQDYFFDPHKYEQYRRVTEQAWPDYLFGDARLLRRQLVEVGEWARELTGWLDSCRADLASEAHRYEQSQEALANETHNSARLEQALKEEVATRVRTQEEAEQARARALAEVAELSERLRTTKDAAVKTDRALKDTRRTLERLQKSTSYRVGRFVTAVPRGIKRALASLRVGR